MTFKDHFSAQASEYARYRPQYPPALFEYLASASRGHDLAWDCGTGNGQAAIGLAPYFKQVIATDASEGQLSNAFQHEKVTYRVAPAEDGGLEPGSADLATVAQALHWFDIPRFFEEARRTLKPGGVVAVWCYTLTRVNPAVNTIIDHFYYETVGPYWPPERRIVDDAYRSIVFPFEEWQAQEFSIQLGWDLADMLGYLRTWSPTRRFIQQNGYDPVVEVEEPLREAWGNPDADMPVRWPIHVRIGHTAGAVQG